jgi:hypothetical protein
VKRLEKPIGFENLRSTVQELCETAVANSNRINLRA